MTSSVKEKNTKERTLKNINQSIGGFKVLKIFLITLFILVFIEEPIDKFSDISIFDTIVNNFISFNWKQEIETGINLIIICFLFQYSSNSIKWMKILYEGILNTEEKLIKYILNMEKYNRQNIKFCKEIIFIWAFKLIFNALNEWFIWKSYQGISTLAIPTMTSKTEKIDETFLWLIQIEITGMNVLKILLLIFIIILIKNVITRIFTLLTINFRRLNKNILVIILSSILNLFLILINYFYYDIFGSNIYMSLRFTLYFILIEIGFILPLIVFSNISEWLTLSRSETILKYKYKNVSKKIRLLLISTQVFLAIYVGGFIYWNILLFHLVNLSSDMLDGYFWQQFLIKFLYFLMCITILVILFRAVRLVDNLERLNLERES